MIDLRAWAANSAMALSLMASPPALLSSSFAAAAGDGGVLTASYAPTGGSTSVPYGWADFCRRYAGECDSGPLSLLDVNLTTKTMKEIGRVGRWVNAHVKPVSDMEHWGVIDRWDYPSDGKGDCEDFALLKRKILIDEGYPRQALLMTVVKDEHNEGHAVLTVKTSDGEFVLDNMTDDVKPWDQTGYRFVKRQSQSDQNAWVQIGDPTAAPAYVSR